MHRWSLSVACLVIASAASAKCPVGDDMDRGVTLSREEPLFASTFTRRSDGLIEERRVSAKDGALRVKTTLYHGGLVPLEMKIRGGPTLRNRIAKNATMPPLPISPGQYEVNEVTYANGKPVGEATSKILVGSAYDSVAIRDCQYVTRKIRVSSNAKVAGKSLTTHFEHDYSTELGIIIRTTEYGDDSFLRPAKIVEYDNINAEGL